MTDRYVVVRRDAARDLIDLSRQAALVLKDRLNDPVDRPLADALHGAASEMATDMAEPVLG
jgi:hypothetical protein